MRVFVCTDHDAHWPVGAASVVVAETEAKARVLLALALVADGLDFHGDEELVEVDLSKPHVQILVNGDY